jgi:KaiC/GvpD/RAD55 family RecA-like ATPase
MERTKGDPSAPATKADIQLIMAELGKLYDANQRWKNEMKEHFDLTVENIRHDLEGANRDQIDVLKDRSTDHQRRIVRLEKLAGLGTA